MRWIEKIKDLIAPKKSYSLDDERLLRFFGIDGQGDALQETTYYTCMKMLGETLGKMPLKFYQKTEQGNVAAAPNDAFECLRTRPNKLMTPTLFWTVVENNRNHYGNAYVWIQSRFKRRKYGGEYQVENLWIMPSANVEVMIDNQGFFGDVGGLWYIYTDDYTHNQYVFAEDEVMHFKTSMSFDGILGLPVREILKLTIENGAESQKYINSLYKDGMTAKMALNYIGELNSKGVEKLLRQIEQRAKGAANAGNIVPVPPGMQLQPLDIKLTDAQFLELKKYTATQIAGAFGIKPNQINDYEKSSYANSEMQQLSFYVDTELFILKMYEEEIRYKLLTDTEIKQGFYFKFNEKALLRTDAKTQCEIITKYVNNAVYSPNEAREILDYKKDPDGDVLVMNGNYIPLKDVGKQYIKDGGEGNQSDL